MCWLVRIQLPRPILEQEIMSLELHLSWKVLITIPDNGPNYQTDHKLFNIRTGKSFLKRMGGIHGLDFEPKVLEPTNVFHNAIQNIKRKHGFTGRKFPYNLNPKSATPAKHVNYKIHLYGANIAIITVKLSPIITQSNNIDFSKVQDLKTYKDIYKVTLSIAGLILSGTHKNYNKSSTLKTYPCILISGNKHELKPITDTIAVETLTRHANVNIDIINSVIKKNQKHQLDKSNILLDRQGIFARNPYQQALNHSIPERKFISSCHMLELAIATSRLLATGYFTSLSSIERECITELIKKPENIFIYSVTAKNSWSLLVKEFSLLQLLEKNDCTKVGRVGSFINAMNLRPGILGISIDLKKLFPRKK